MQFEVWIPEITLHRDGPHLLNWSVINRHGQRSYEWACVCQLTKGLWLNWPHHHSVKAWGIWGTLWHLRSPSYLRTIWRVGGNQLLLRGCSHKTDQSLMVFPSDQSWVQGPGEQRWQEQLCPTSVRPLLCTIFGKHIHHPCTAMKK